MVGWLSIVAEWLLPARCVACQRPGNWWCDACDATVVAISNPTCPRCNRLTSRGEYCRNCRRQAVLTGILAGAHFRQPLPAAIKALKYRHAKAIVPELIQYQILALARLQGLPRARLVPIPLHPARLRRRGHNQAALLAAALSNATGLSLGSGLRRIQNTPSQTGLDRSQRQQNVDGSFRWSGPPPPQLVILVDDVVTTGATLNAAATACREAGARIIWGLVVAKR